MTYHTHGTIGGLDIPAALAALFAAVTCGFAYATATFGYTLRGLVAAYGATLALSMWWSVQAEVNE